MGGISEEIPFYQMPLSSIEADQIGPLVEIVVRHTDERAMSPCPCPHAPTHAPKIDGNELNILQVSRRFSEIASQTVNATAPASNGSNCQLLADRYPPMNVVCPP